MSISLVVIAAILASLAVVRHRQENRRPDSEPQPESAPVALDLDELRSAGF